MAKRTGAKAEARIPLSRERVLSAAIALADESGIESLSMRKLAERLGVEAMSLYNHIANKNDLLEGIVEAAAGEIVTPADDVDWKKAIHEVAISAHEALLRHPWASGLWMGTTPGPARMRYGDSLLGAFRGAGFSKDLTYHAYHIVESYVLGFTTQVLNFRSVDESQFEDVVAAFIRGDYAEEFPHFTEHALQHMEPHDDGVNAVELGLDLILDGLERLRDAA
ncbi:MAG TPA: TetR/AcrR family transcriptional regulator C-terminal domain-containing protein [Gaiellaceae bacterium]|jgi:AcrR family transcriptional regulator|nr:TetR/AcrR family transcriptional regulator C-terminal domain-containing protein [Gaiellaceae bacterium]